MKTPLNKYALEEGNIRNRPPLSSQQNNLFITKYTSSKIK